MRENPTLLLTRWNSESNYLDNSCRMTLNQEVCGQPTIVRFECCDGYEQVDNLPGCSGMKPMTDLLTTAKELRLSEAVMLARDPEINTILRKQGAFTWFVPHNEALSKLSSQMTAQLRGPRDRSATSTLLYHVAKRRVMTSEFGADALQETLYFDGNVRLNRYANGAVTVNCARVVQPDRRATNGVIHVIDRVLTPPDTRVSVMTVLKRDARFQRFASAIVDAGLEAELLSVGGGVTVFAPTDDAFRKVSGDLLRSILADRDALRELGTQRLEQISRNRVQLRRLLLYHMGGGKLSTHTFIDDQNVPTLAGAHNLRVQVLTTERDRQATWVTLWRTPTFSRRTS
ncbi:PREDICTED: transforming growth factor-beta-induced protein ig-h3-like isoform X2 [Priapulus caudatus]|uniref:Transforming growth factor-beta-induced protein ig-h3-like isoform X2 n=1 Tax=Priapulus caudatus TaxID=37621 RepID=A0ABM1F0Z0_PRICU|nr:PREDICTED: transforming growth factor-beta-induced protein ig-h3-like isoform X2 [Priapulus caudatus]